MKLQIHRKFLNGWLEDTKDIADRNEAFKQAYSSIFEGIKMGSPQSKRRRVFVVDGNRIYKEYLIKLYEKEVRQNEK